MRRRHAHTLRAFALDARASAGIELGVGAVVLLSVAGLCFDLYSRVGADTAAAHLATTMADYVSRGPDTASGTLDGKALEALGQFLHEHTLGVPVDLVFVVSALRQPVGAAKSAGTPKSTGEVLWSDDALRFGDATVTAALAADCARFVAESGGTTTAKLPDGFTMAAGEVLVVVEVCARLTGAGTLTGRFVAGDVYRLHALPVREPERGLPAPVRGGDAVAGA